jgi:hypothetical protein
MKKTLLLISFLSCLILFTSCKKDSFESVKSKIIGSWELRDFQGGWGPVNASDLTPGNGNILKFSDSKYQFYSQGQLTSSGTYRITKMDTYNGAYPESALFLNSDQDPMARIRVVENTLTMYVGTIAADGYIAKYVRQ